MSFKNPEKPIIAKLWEELGQKSSGQEPPSEPPSKKKVRPEPIVIQAWRSISGPKNDT